MTLIFDNYPPLPNICSKRCSKSLLSLFQRKKSLKRAKNVVFFLFCDLVDRQMRGGYRPPCPPPWLRYCIYHKILLKHAKYIHRLKSSGLKWCSYFAQQNHFPPRNIPMNQYLSESTLNFTQTQKVLWRAHGWKLQQNTLNIQQNFIKTR